MEDKKQIIENIQNYIRNARVDLEQGGKYDWNSDLQRCDYWLEMVLKKCEELK